MTQEECWKDIEGYEGFYQVSNLGNIRSKYSGKWKLMKATKTNHSRMIVGLYKNGKAKLFLVHRLVAQSFMPNPNRLPEINHKDENPLNNCVENLEWCNQCYNSNYGTSKYRISAKLKNGILSKPVEQYCKNGMFIMEYPSAIEASRVLGLNVSGIISCCNNNPKYSHCGGYQWKYKGSEKQINNIVNKIAQMDKCGKIINIFESTTQASNATGISRTAIANNLSYLSKSAGGFIWKKI